MQEKAGHCERMTSIRPGKRDHIEKEYQFKSVIDDFEECFASSWKDSNKLFDFDGKTFFAAVADT